MLPAQRHKAAGGCEMAPAACELVSRVWSNSRGMTALGEQETGRDGGGHLETPGKVSA